MTDDDKPRGGIGKRRGFDLAVRQATGGAQIAAAGGQLIVSHPCPSRPHDELASATRREAMDEMLVTSVITDLVGDGGLTVHRQFGNAVDPPGGSD
jgi:hypothetical protein